MNPLQVNIDLSFIHFGQLQAPLSIMTIRLHFQIYKLEIITFQLLYWPLIAMGAFQLNHFSDPRMEIENFFCSCPKV